MKKGFTLIELLAVIIILAVIALIATPLILDVVSDAEEESRLQTVNGYIEATRMYISEAMINNSSLEGNLFDTIKGRVKGTKPEVGEIFVSEGNKIAVALKLDGYCYIKNYDDIKATKSDNAECTLSIGGNGTVVITGNPIRNKFAPLILDANGECDLTKAYEYMGGCYLKADASTILTNHIWYNGFLWRIMGINNLGTANESIKMITEEVITSIPHGVAGNKDFNGSYVDDWLNNYFYNKLSNENNLKEKIIVGDFCQEETLEYTTSRQNCTNGTLFSRNVGLISIDEYNLAGGVSSYLKSGQSFWTLTPYSNNILKVSESGGVSTAGAVYAYGIRPVINVDVDSVITSGTGTLKDFYVLGEYKNETDTIETLSAAKIGEYVRLNDKLYRVVENGIATKLILDSLYEENGVVLKMSYGDDEIFNPTATVGVGYKLNSNVLDWLTKGDKQEQLKSMILTSDWYQNRLGIGQSYTISLATNDNPISAKVGLIRVGEMLSGFSYSMTTKNGTEVGNKSNVANNWALTINTDRYFAWGIISNGEASVVDIGFTYRLRPVINIASISTISGGNGTLERPFVVEIK